MENIGMHIKFIISWKFINYKKYNSYNLDNLIK